MQRIKHLIYSNPFRTEPSPVNNDKVARSWDVVVGHLKNEEPVIHYSSGFKPSPKLAQHGIGICSHCGYLQPTEVLACKNCGQI